MELYDSRYFRLRDQLKLAVDYCFVFSIPRGAWAISSILVAKLLRRPYINLPVPGTRRTIRLRTDSSDIGTYNQIFVRREYDFSYLPHAAQFRSSKDVTDSRAQGVTIVDCGANVGCSVMWFANEFPGAKIVAIEPDLANFELLNQNVADLDDVRTIRAALWSSETRVVISNPDAKAWAFRTEAAEGNMDPERPLIDTVTMDGLLANNTESTSVIVKIDIEGAEQEVFSKNTSWLRLVDLLIIELHDHIFPRAGNGLTFFSAVASKHMDYIWRGENLFCFQARESPKSCDCPGRQLVNDRFEEQDRVPASGGP
jgi:FkbM family methyltransferase